MAYKKANNYKVKIIITKEVKNARNFRNYYIGDRILVNKYNEYFYEIFVGEGFDYIPKNHCEVLK